MPTFHSCVSSNCFCDFCCGVRKVVTDSVEAFRAMPRAPIRFDNKKTDTALPLSPFYAAAMSWQFPVEEPRQPPPPFPLMRMNAMLPMPKMRRSEAVSPFHAAAIQSFDDEMIMDSSPYAPLERTYAMKLTYHT